jgi:hypothetical protein
LAERSLCRHTPEVGAVCGKAARTVLCGGRTMKRTSLPLPASFAVERNSSPVSPNAAARIAARISPGCRRCSARRRNPGTAPPLGFRHSRTHSPRSLDRNDTTGLCPNKSEAPALPSYDGWGSRPGTLSSRSATGFIAALDFWVGCAPTPRSRRPQPSNRQGGARRIPRS